MTKKEIVEEIEEIEETEIETKKAKKLPILINNFKSIKEKNNKIIINSMCLIKIFGEKKYDLKKIKIEINGKECDVNFKMKRSIKFIKGYEINFYKIEIPLEDTVTTDIQNKIIVKYKDFDKGRILYTAFDLTKGKNKNSKTIMYNNRSIYLRQTPKNTMYLTVREISPYDYTKNKIKLRIGYLLSKLMLKKDFVLLFEKESERYEESASVVYEKLIDMGYKNAYYIINKDNPALNKIDNKYKKNILYKNSLKHIIYFFKCKKFVGTESLGHAIQLRAGNKLIADKINAKDLMYVFLQHGVMYMVSLSSDLRTGFKKMPIKLHKIVTSSEEEAKHFTDLGGFDREDLYVCGLPKFDTAVRNKNAD